MGLLNTIETLLSVMEDQPQIMAQLQPTVLQVIAHIFGQSVMGSFHLKINFISILNLQKLILIAINFYLF